MFVGRDLTLTFTYFYHLNEVHSHVKAVLFLSKNNRKAQNYLLLLSCVFIQELDGGELLISVHCILRFSEVRILSVQGVFLSYKVNGS